MLLHDLRVHFLWLWVGGGAPVGDCAYLGAVYIKKLVFYAVYRYVFDE